MKSSLFGVCFLALGCAEQIDPKIYARLFMNNKPMFERMSDAVSEKLPTNGTVLDLASGPGEPTVTLATKRADAKIVCTDFQEPMNEKAKGRAKSSGVEGGIEFATTSADDLSKWGDDYFDAVMMSFGLMFVPNKAKSLEEIYRVLKPGGYAYISVWKILPFMDFAHEVLEKAAGKEMPPFAINPLALQEENVVENFAKAAKLNVVADERLTYVFSMGTADETADGLTILAGTMLKELETSGDNDVKAKFHKETANALQERGWQTEHGATIPGNTPQLLILQKPLNDEL